MLGDPQRDQGVLEVFLEFGDPVAQRVDSVLQLEDPLDAGEVDALLLGEPLHLAEQRDVAGRVAPAAAGGAARATCS